MKTALEVLFESVQESAEFKGMENFERFKELSEGEDKEACEVTTRAMKSYASECLREAAERMKGASMKSEKELTDCILSLISEINGK